MRKELGNVWVFVQRIHKANEDQKSAVHKPKHCLTPGFLIPLNITLRDDAVFHGLLPPLKRHRFRGGPALKSSRARHPLPLPRDVPHRTAEAARVREQPRRPLLRPRLRRGGKL